MTHIYIQITLNFHATPPVLAGAQAEGPSMPASAVSRKLKKLLGSYGEEVLKERYSYLGIRWPYSSNIMLRE